MISTNVLSVRLMRGVITIIIFALFAFDVQCQSIERWIITPFGNSYNNNFQIVQATLGEPVITTVTDSFSLILTQGFQQPTPSELPAEDYKREIKIFPNPATEKCTVQFFVKDVTEFNIDVWDMIGNIMYRKRITEVFSGQVQIIDMTRYIQGIYFIRVYSDNDEMKMLEKVVKL